MVNLEKAAGLPVELKEDFSLEFGGEVQAGSSEVKQYPIMKNLMKDPDASPPRRTLYVVYPDVAIASDREQFQQAGLSYDLIVIPPGQVGDEFAKTTGAYHRHPVVYEVIHGQAYFVLQASSSDFEQLTTCFIVEASRGEKIIVPPEFGAVAVNPADDVLPIACLKAVGDEPVTEPYEARQGAAFYVSQSQRLSKSGETRPDVEFVPNLNYKQLPELGFARARELAQYGLRSALPLYYSLAREPNSFDFLKVPDEHKEELTVDKLFVFRASQ